MNKTKRKFVTFFIFLLTILANLPSNHSIVLSVNNAIVSNILDGGWVENRDGVIIIHVSGSNYEMGYQHGYYLKEEYMICHRAWLSFLEKKNVTLDDMIQFWNDVNSSYPNEYKEEIEGRSEALGLTFEEVAAMEMIGIALYKPKECFGIIPWGPATEDGKLLHIYSGDFSLDLKDPITGNFALNYQIIVVRKPNDGFASVYYGLPTEIGAEGGVNEQGLVISYTALITDNSSFNGFPCSLRQLMVLDYASNAEESVDIVNSNRTGGWSFIIGDSKKNVGYVVEQHADYAYAGTWNNSVESNYPSWIIDHMVRRGNVYIDPVSAGIGPDIYKNSTFTRYILKKLGFINEENLFPNIAHFVAGSKTFERHSGRLNLNNSMKFLRRFYVGLTNLMFFLVQKLFFSYGTNWHQHVICPETGDIRISLSHNRISAHRCKVHYFNMYDLFNAQPEV